MATVIHAGSYFTSTYQNHLYEIIWVFLSIATHILDAREHIFSRILIFPGLLLSVYVYSNRQLYGKVLYSVVSVILNVYAYFLWKGRSKRPPVQVSKTPTKTFLLIVFLGLLNTGILAYIMDNYLNISLSTIYLDATYTSFGFIEKWLMSHKKLERWALAFLRYLVFAIACYSSGSSILAIHHIVLACIAIYGQYKWYRSYKHI